MIVKKYLSAAVATAFLFTAGICLAQQYPDNTGVNKRDRASQELTADEQGQSNADIQITQEVRKAVLNDTSVSMYAKNIKLITNDGVVTLKGPVESIEERLLIERIAARVPGVNRVQNEIDVMSK